IYDAFMIERLTQGDEYRVLIHDGRPICFVEKRQPSLVGDGVSSVRALLDATNAALSGTGVSPSMASSLQSTTYQLTDVPPAGAAIKLAGRRNLSALGGVDVLSEEVPEDLAAIAVRSCQALGLRLGAVDLFDTSSAGDRSALTVIEVNGNPTL